MPPETELVKLESFQIKQAGEMMARAFFAIRWFSKCFPMIKNGENCCRHTLFLSFGTSFFLRKFSQRPETPTL